MGWFSKIEQPLVRDALDRALAAVLRSRPERGQEDQVHAACTTASPASSRTARGRSIADPDVVVSPCDAIVGACGADRRHRAPPDQGLSLHARGPAGRRRSWWSAHRDGRYVTLRLTSSMYHRFHAPHDCRVEQVTYISGDTWNVNPIALKRVEKLFCKNERAVIRDPAGSDAATCVTLVPVAAILVASIRLHCLDALLHVDTAAANVDPLRRRLSQGRRDGLVRARVDHRRARRRGRCHWRRTFTPER